MKIRAKLTNASLNIGSSSVTLMAMVKGQQFQPTGDKPYTSFVITTPATIALEPGKEFLITIEEAPQEEAKPEVDASPSRAVVQNISTVGSKV